MLLHLPSEILDLILNWVSIISNDLTGAVRLRQVCRGLHAAGSRFLVNNRKRAAPLCRAKYSQRIVGFIIQSSVTKIPLLIGRSDQINFVHRALQNHGVGFGGFYGAPRPWSGKPLFARTSTMCIPDLQLATKGTIARIVAGRRPFCATFNTDDPHGTSVALDSTSFLKVKLECAHDCLPLGSTAFRWLTEDKVHQLLKRLNSKRLKISEVAGTHTLVCAESARSCTVRRQVANTLPSGQRSAIVKLHSQGYVVETLSGLSIRTSKSWWLSWSQCESVCSFPNYRVGKVAAVLYKEDSIPDGWVAQLLSYIPFGEKLELSIIGDAAVTRSHLQSRDPPNFAPDCTLAVLV